MVLTFPAAYHNHNVIFFSLVYIALLWLVNFFFFFFFFLVARHRKRSCWFLTVVWSYIVRDTTKWRAERICESDRNLKKG